MSGEASSSSSSSANALIPRTGAAPKLIAGPKTGQKSLYQQHVLDEDTYTDALSHIISRDFFPNLPHLHATNDYLKALTDNDPELLSASIRRLAALAQEKEMSRTPVGGRRSLDDIDAERARRTELAMTGTPYIALPGARGRPMRTPVGARGWETPAGVAESSRSARRRYEEYDELDGMGRPGGSSSNVQGPGAGLSRPIKRKRQREVRDDLSLDAFQRNYTSEDNASFVQIVDQENARRREERWGWAWEAEKKAEQRRLVGEEKRKMILDAATSGNWRVNGEGRRLIGGLAEGGSDKAVGEAWKDVKLIEGLESDEAKNGHNDLETSGNGSSEESVETGALIPHASGSSSASTALIKVAESPSGPSANLAEIALPPKHPLTQALAEAGLPGTALISTEDGQIVPYREGAAGASDGRGRGAEEKSDRERIERAAMGDEEKETVSLGGSGADQWGYKTRNNLMFPADSNTAPYPKPKPSTENASVIANPPSISHANTRLPDDEDVGPASASRAGSSRRGSSPARSWVDAAVRGTPYHREPSMPTIDSYPLLPNDPSPSPHELPSLLTWGTLLATPRALDGDGDSSSNDPLDSNSTPARSFTMPETKRRDELGRKLGDKASRSMNARAKSFLPPPTPQSRTSTATPGRSSSSLSSALRSAADKTQRSVRGGGGGAGGGSGGSVFGGNMLPPSATPRRADNLTPAARKLLERSVGRSPMPASSSSSNGMGTKMGMSTGGRNRGAVMESRSGWGGLGGTGAKIDKRMSWTPSPRK
ncbi:hypothetical protein I317_07267 [Kwoniella heveanensis CBS 569]|uniref:Protein DGCR14 n=1 Tax=Kwoniella heveanensis BCC8398 TaxID=1296120 RepID=A0A1B9GXZ1_9TREE|nr:hypothetical protein I316_02372 [Kwoniella heveanensis BCC8398]OCF38930.1 hypothetical protein I317_07267 [Kwoniella heveanensis CBS 569]